MSHSSSTVVEKAALLPSAELMGCVVHRAAQRPVTKTRATDAEEVPAQPACGSGGSGGASTDPSVQLAALLRRICPHPTLEREIKVKVVVLGGSSVGKSAVVRSIRNMPFVAEAAPTVGYDIFSLLYSRSEAGNRQVRVELWDVSHRELDCDDARWARILAHAAAVMLVCDAWNHRSFVAVDAWRARVVRARPVASLKLHLVVNKSDLAPPTSQRGGGGSSGGGGSGSNALLHAPRFAVGPEVLEKYTRLTGFSGFATTSAKTGAGIHPTFDALVQSVLATAQSSEACRRQWRDTTLPYVLATWPHPAARDAGIPLPRSPTTAVATGFWGVSSGSGGADENLALGHRALQASQMRLHRVVEDLSALALPTSAFATQETAAVLTTRRPEHAKHHRAVHTASLQGGAADQGGGDGGDGGGGSSALDGDSGLATHVVILSAALRQCIDEAYHALGTALQTSPAPGGASSSRDSDGGMAGGNGGGGGDGDSRRHSDDDSLRKQLEEQRREELLSLHAALRRLPVPAAAAFVARAPEVLTKLQVLRRRLLRNIAHWQFAFRTLAGSGLSGRARDPARHMQRERRQEREQERGQEREQ